MIDPAPYIDSRNRALWKEIRSSGYTVSVEYSRDPHYACYTQGNSIKLYVTAPLSPASFAHELLHAKLYINGMLTGKCFSRCIAESPILSHIVSSETTELVGNCMEHIKMLPAFRAMGYADKEFIADYDKKKMNFLWLARYYYNYTHANRQWAIDRIIGSTIAMKADCNPSHHYECYLRVMQLFEPQLIRAINSFWQAWIKYDIACQAPDFPYLCNDFYDDIHYFVSTLETIYS